MNAHSLKTAFLSSFSGHTLLSVLAVAALLLLSGWLLWPRGAIQAQSSSESRSASIQLTATMKPGNPTTEDDVALTGLALPEDYVIDPEFQTSTYRYTLTAPADTRWMAFTGFFTPTYGSTYRDTERYGFGLLTAGTKAESEAIDNATRFAPIHLFLANSQGSQGSQFTHTTALDPPGSTTTIEIRVYKKRPGRAHNWPTHDPQTSVWKIYTLEVTRELPANDVATLYDLAISGGWLDFDTDTARYTVYVKQDVGSVVLTPSTWHPEATVTVNGNEPANAVSLNEGNNVIAVVVTAPDGVATQTYQVTVVRNAAFDAETGDFSKFISQMYGWRNDPQWSSYKTHTDRWDRALLAFGETVTDVTLTPMTAAEAEALANRGSAWHRWETAAAALRALEAFNQQRRQQLQGAPPAIFIPQGLPAALGDVTIVKESGTRTVPLSGVFGDADSDALTITAASSDEAVAAVSVAADYSSLTLTAKSRGTATITVTADDGNGGTVEDTFTVRVKAAPVVASSLADVSGLAAGATREVSLSGVFSDPDGDALTITVISSDETVATVTVSSDGSTLTLTGVSEGTATITATAQDTDGNRVSDDFDVSVGGEYAALIVKMKEWRNDPCCASEKEHTDRWDRALLAFGEAVADANLTPMTAAEAQRFADRGWSRWEDVAEALGELEADDQRQDPPQVTPNRAPTVSSALGDVTIVKESGTRTVSLSGVFADADSDSLTITASSSNETVATVSVASGYSTLTVTAKSRGEATITVTADDGNGGTVEDAFTVRVKAGPVVSSSLSDVSGLELGATRDVSLSGVFSDADGDSLTITAASSDDAVVSAFVFRDTLTITALAEGTATITVTAQDTDGNRVSDALDVSVSRVTDPTPTPTPEPTPTPQPPADSSLTGAAARYDANGDGKIDMSEYQQAVRDYADGKITYEEMLEVTLAAFGGG